MEDVSALSRTELFSSLPREALARVASAAQPVQLGRNETLFEEGDDASCMYVVGKGRVGIAKRSPDGRESIFALMGPGDVFGEMPLFDREPRSASARALERSQLQSLPYEVVRAELETEPEALWDVVALIARRLRTADDAIADAMLLDVTGRTAKRLLELAGDADEFVLPITQEELAGLVGASRERVNKALAAFARLGWVEQSDRHYRIKERDRLTQRSR